MRSLCGILRHCVFSEYAKLTEDSAMTSVTMAKSVYKYID